MAPDPDPQESQHNEAELRDGGQMARRVLDNQKTSASTGAASSNCSGTTWPRDDIELILVFGQAEPDEARKHDLACIDWGHA